MIVDKEYIIKAINNYQSLSNNINLIRDYCSDNGKDDAAIEVFLIKIREELALQQARNKIQIFTDPNQIYFELAKYIIDKKVIEFNIIFLMKNNQIIKMF